MVAAVAPLRYLAFDTDLSCVVCLVSCVLCRVSCVVCLVSCVVCRVSCVCLIPTCRVYLSLFLPQQGVCLSLPLSSEVASRREGVTVFEQVHVSPGLACLPSVHILCVQILCVQILSHFDMLKEHKTHHDDNTPDVRTRR